MEILIYFIHIAAYPVSRISAIQQKGIPESDIRYLTSSLSGHCGTLFLKHTNFCHSSSEMASWGMINNEIEKAFVVPTTSLLIGSETNSYFCHISRWQSDCLCWHWTFARPKSGPTRVRSFPQSSTRMFCWPRIQMWVNHLSLSVVKCFNTTFNVKTHLCWVY